MHSSTAMGVQGTWQVQVLPSRHEQLWGEAGLEEPD